LSKELDVHLETAGEAAPEVGPPDGEGGDLSPTPDAGDAHDATDETPDAPGDLAIETFSTDAPTDSPGADHAGTDARPDDQPCGPSGAHCGAYACDVALGMCKTICFSDDDCFERRACRQGVCGNRIAIACTANDECMSGFCAQGICCQAACNQACYSCALAASTGSCQRVPANTADPDMRCPTGNVCDGYGQCVPSTCTVAADCGRYHSCSNGHCSVCFATCAQDTDCAAPNVCHDNNGCTQCGPADAGVD